MGSERPAAHTQQKLTDVPPSPPTQVKTTLQYRHTMYFVEQVSDQHFLQML